MKVVSQIALVVVVMTGNVALTSAQQRSGGFGFRFGSASSALTTVAAHESVHKELGLSADTSSKLRELGEDYDAARQKELRNAGVDFQNFRDLSNEERQQMTEKASEVNSKLEKEFDPKLRALVSPEQLKRIQQINVQLTLRRGGLMALMESDQLAELKLTDEQRGKIIEINTEFGRRQRELFAGGGGGNREAFTKSIDERNTKTMEILTAEQKEALNKIKGAEFDVSQLGFGGRGRRGKN